MIDVRALIGDIPTTDVTLRTFAAPSIDMFGESSTSVAAEVTVTAVVHPTGRRDLERLPEADRQRELISVYVLDGWSSSRPAEIDYQGATYEVIRAGDYATLGGIYLITAALVEESA